MMFITLILSVLFAGEAFCQYIHHPFGAFSYVSNTFHHGVGYSYVAPSGQIVNVKYATGALVHPQTSTSSQNLFNGAVPAPLALSVNQDQQYANFQPDRIFGLSQNLPARRPPTAESLFTPASSGAPISSDKQLQAFGDYLNQLQQENSGITTEVSVDLDSEFESLANLKFDSE